MHLLKCSYLGLCLIHFFIKYHLTDAASRLLFYATIRPSTFVELTLHVPPSVRSTKQIMIFRQKAQYLHLVKPVIIIFGIQTWVIQFVKNITAFYVENYYISKQCKHRTH